MVYKRTASVYFFDSEKDIEYCFQVPFLPENHASVIYNRLKVILAEKEIDTDMDIVMYRLIDNIGRTISSDDILSEKGVDDSKDLFLFTNYIGER